MIVEQEKMLVEEQAEASRTSIPTHSVGTRVKVRWENWQGLSTNRRIFSGMVIVAMMTLITKGLAAGKEIAVADYFGAGGAVDAFLFAYLLAAFSINVLSGAFCSAMMPAYIRTRDNKGRQAADKLFASLILIGIVFLLIATLVLAVFAPVLLSLLGAGFNQQTMVLTHELFYWLLPIVVLTGCGHVFAAAINADERFAIVALTPAITPICTIIAVVTLVEQWGIFTLVAGAVTGAVIELFVLILLAAQKNISVLPWWNGMTEELRAVLGQYTPMVAGALLMSSTGLVDQSMAAMLESGSVATLNYANKVVAMISGIGAMALGTAVLPHFSRLAGQQDWFELRRTFKTYTRLIILFSVPVTALLFFGSQPVIRLLFEHGAFTSTDTVLVARVQAMYVLQIPFYLLGILGSRLINSLAKNEVLMKIAMVNLIINSMGNYIFMQYFGIAGIALSTSVVYVLSTGMIFICLAKSGKYQCT